MAIIHQLDRRSGLTYVYESVSHWDSEKKQSRAKRTLIGRLDPETGEVVPTDGRGHRRGQGGKEKPAGRRGRRPARDERLLEAATWLVDEVLRRTGAVDALRASLPSAHRELRSLAAFLLTEEKAPLSAFWKWSRLRRHPYGADLSPERCAEVLARVDGAARTRFFRALGSRHPEDEYWVCVTTPISAWTDLARRPRAARQERAGPSCLALVLGASSRLPVCCRRLPGSLPDARALRELSRDLDFLAKGRMRLILDRGFFSVENVNELYRRHCRFIVGSNSTLSHAREFIREIGPGRDSPAAYDSARDIYAFSRTIIWNYEQRFRYKGFTLREGRRMYLHLYFSPEKHLADARVFSRIMDSLKNELSSGRRVPSHERYYHQYFTIRQTPARGVTLAYNSEAITQARERHGFFVLLSNEVKDPLAALDIYGARDALEKSLLDIRERLDIDPALLEAAGAADGGLDAMAFVEFLALLVSASIRQGMQRASLPPRYTPQKLFEELDAMGPGAPADAMGVAGPAGESAGRTATRPAAACRALGLAPPAPSEPDGASS